MTNFVTTIPVQGVYWVQRIVPFQFSGNFFASNFLGKDIL